ncbi:MAG: GMC oxidoreductase, partial [Tomitella sp.]|nr:GMC oxidoreductase [Tomitella sp.]
ATGQEWDAAAIVIGSGFGGAVAAARLAQAGLSVLVIERGRRWPAGSFPREPNLGAGWLWKRGHGLYDLRWLGRMASVQASGWGGGSLVYANVFARPPHILLDERWPGHLRRDELDPYYDLAAHMLEVHPTTVDPSSGRLPGRTQMVQDLVGSMDLTGEAMFRPNLAVTFGDPDTVRTNIHGVKRRGCAFGGECVAGCNHGAKNSLDYTYLAVAEAAGARTLTDSQVDRLAPVPGGYQVSVSTPSDPSAAPRRFTAAQVFLAAGAVASTELLLRARDVHRTLPQLSRRLGEGFSGNGDYLDLADIRTTTDLTTGPTITTSTVLDVPEGKRSVWFQVQDGAIPSSLSRLIEHLIPARTARRTWRRLRPPDDRQRFALRSMGRDSGKGVLRLNRRGVARLRWQNRWQGHLYRAQGRVAPLIARSLGSSVFAPPTWSVFRRTVTVHPLGGVPTGPDANTAVADDLGEVHGAPGLYVIDGSVIPAATGVNPSATILAAAERSIEHIIRRSGQPKWRAPEWSPVQHTPAP